MKLLSALIATLALCPALAAAQVTINPAALAQLAGISPARPAAAAPKPPAPVARHVIIHPRKIVAAEAKPLPPAPVPVAARVPAPPAPKPAAPKPSPPKPAAPPAPVTLVFAEGSAKLPANAGTAIKPFCKSIGVIGIDARAPGDPSDPSIAMRLSLARALAVRDALTACGVPPQNIIPRALGSVPGQNEDETVLGARN
ncbi:MAG TPA: OmpA family protein [Acidocella sp.]|nr:OmpA family protein [Acidocella sp.]